MSEQIAFDIKAPPPCHDSTYSGKVQVEAFFTSFGTTWHWHLEKGKSNDYGMSATERDNRDKAHANSVLRSRFIVLTANTSVSVVTLGGKGGQASVEGQSATPNGNTTEKGFLGVAVQLVSAGQWVLSKRRSNSSKDFETLTFSPEELAAYVGQTVTIDIVDFCHGKWGWICAKSLLIQGTCQAAALGQELARLQQALTAEARRAKSLEGAIEVERQTTASFEAQVRTLREQQCASSSPKAAKNQEEETPTADNGAGERETRLKARVAELEAQLEASKHGKGCSEQNGEEEKVPAAIPTYSDRTEKDDQEEDSDLRMQIRDLKIRLQRSEASANALKSAASRGAEQLQMQTNKVRELERRLGDGEGAVVGVTVGAVKGVARLIRCMVRPRRRADHETEQERTRLQSDPG